MTDDERKSRERLDFVFSIPGENQFEARLWDTTTTEPLPRNWYLKEHTAGNDTITLWIRDSSVYKRDTLNVILSYFRSDSTGRHVMYADTSRYTFKEKKETERKGKKKEEASAITFLDIKSNVSGDLDLKGRLFLEFDRPIDKSTLQGLKLSQKVDTVLKM